VNANGKDHDDEDITMHQARPSTRVGRQRSVIVAFVAVLALPIGLLLGLAPSAPPAASARDEAPPFADRGEPEPGPAMQGTESASARSLETRQPLEDPGARVAPAALRLYDALSGAGVADAQVRAQLATGPPIVGASDTTGLLEFEALGACELWIEAGGYLPLRTHALLSSAGLELALEPAAELELVFRDGAGRGVPGLEVQLLPPLTQGPAWGAGWPSEFSAHSLRDAERRRDAIAASLEVAPEGLPRVELTRGSDLPGGRALEPVFDWLDEELAWRAHTDADGRVLWSGLPARAGGRWGLLSRRHIELEPPHETRRFVASGERWEAGNRPPRGLSGELELYAGERSLIELECPGLATLIGRVDSRSAPTVRPIVKLYHRELHTHPNGTTIEAFDFEQLAHADEQGRFRFEDVRPGSKLVRIHWESAPGVLHFLAHACELAPGERRDLGLLSETPGACLRGVVQLRDRSGALVETQDVFPGQERVQAVVRVNAVLDGAPEENNVSEHVALALGQPFELHGLPAGRAWLGLVELLDEPTPGPGMRLGDASQLELDPIPSEPIELWLPVERELSTELCVRFPAGAEPCRLEAWLLPAGDAPARQVDLRRDERAGPGSLSATLRAPRGSYTLLVHSGAPEESGAGSYWLEQPLEIDASYERRELMLGGGAELGGRVLAADGRPRANELLFFSAGAWLQRSRPTWPWRTRTDADGRFQLRGLPPGAVLFCSESPRGIELGAAGSERVVEL